MQFYMFMLACVKASHLQLYYLYNKWVIKLHYIHHIRGEPQRLDHSSFWIKKNIDSLTQYEAGICCHSCIHTHTHTLLLSSSGFTTLYTSVKIKREIFLRAVMRHSHIDVKHVGALDFFATTNIDDSFKQRQMSRSRLNCNRSLFCNKYV